MSSQKDPQGSSQKASAAGTRKPKAKVKRGGDVDTIQNETKLADQLPPTGASSSKKRKIATHQLGGAAHASSSSTGQVPEQEKAILKTDEDVAKNADFAREMAIARAGTQFATSHKSGVSKKDRGAQKHGNLRPNNDTGSPSLSTGASSTTGADADDDLSPAASPPLAATSAAATSKPGDIFDMLEPAGTGPSVLRLSAPANPLPQAKVKNANKHFEPAETKKQRQQRIKREAQRALVEEAERERRRLLENQIKRARMAEGTSAQTRTSNFKPPTENAWFSGPNHASAETAIAPSVGLPSLLDTFESQVELEAYTARGSHTAPSTTVTHRDMSKDRRRTSVSAKEEAFGDERANAPSAFEKDGRDWAKDLPMEEEQMRLIQDSEDSWTTVSKRDKKKVSKQLANKESDTSTASGVDSRHTNGLAPKIAASSRPGISSNSNSYQQLGDSAFCDSDWAA